MNKKDLELASERMGLIYDNINRVRDAAIKDLTEYMKGLPEDYHLFTGEQIQNVNLKGALVVALGKMREFFGFGRNIKDDPKRNNVFGDTKYLKVQFWGDLPMQKNIKAVADKMVSMIGDVNSAEEHDKCLQHFADLPHDGWLKEAAELTDKEIGKVVEADKERAIDYIVAHNDNCCTQSCLQRMLGDLRHIKTYWQEKYGFDDVSSMIDEDLKFSDVAGALVKGEGLKNKCFWLIPVEKRNEVIDTVLSDMAKDKFLDFDYLHDMVQYQVKEKNEKPCSALYDLVNTLNADYQMYDSRGDVISISDEDIFLARGLANSLKKNALEYYGFCHEQLISEMDHGSLANNRFEAESERFLVARGLVEFFSMDLDVLQTDERFFGKKYENFTLEDFAKKDDGVYLIESLCNAIREDAESCEHFCSKNEVFDDAMAEIGGNLEYLDHTLCVYKQYERDEEEANKKAEKDFER